MARILLSLVIILAGFGFSLKAEWLYVQFGKVGFAEKYFRLAGGTRLFYRLLGVFMVFFGFLVMTNLHGEFLSWVLSPLIRVSQPTG